MEMIYSGEIFIFYFLMLQNLNIKNHIDMINKFNAWCFFSCQKYDELKLDKEIIYNVV